MGRGQRAKLQAGDQPSFSPARRSETTSERHRKRASTPQARGALPEAQKPREECLRQVRGSFGIRLLRNPQNQPELDRHVGAISPSERLPPAAAGQVDGLGQSPRAVETAAPALLPAELRRQV